MTVEAPARLEEYVPEASPGVPRADVRATFWRQLSPGTYHWRCLIPARHLPGQVLEFKESDLVADDEWGAIVPRQKGAAVWQFAGNATKGILMAAMQEQGVRVLMEADDNYIVGADLVGPGWQHHIDKTDGKHSYEAHAKLCEFADGIIVSTPNLERWYSEVNKNVYVCPNAVDPDDWPMVKKPNDGILRIGWAASHSHLIDAPLVQRAFKWAVEQKDVEVWVYGIGEVSKFPAGVKRLPWTNSLEEYRRSLSMLDVQVCPLNETPWAAGKSDLKAMEAAMAGSWPIVSIAEPFRPWHDRTLVCRSAKDWERAIRWAVLNRDEIPKLAEEAKRYVLEEREISKTVHLWQEAVG